MSQGFVNFLAIIGGSTLIVFVLEVSESLSRRFFRWYEKRK